MRSWKKNQLVENDSTWQRNLYHKSNYPDNYTPDDVFLAAIERNKHVVTYESDQCIRNACQVGLQFCSVILFQMCYYSLSEKWIPSSLILSILTVLTIMGYVVIMNEGLTIKQLLEDLRLVGIFLAFGLGLSPVLFKLTDTISTDTIYSMSSAGLFLHLLTHSYHKKMSAYSSMALSFNAALFSAVCLASRLTSCLDAFVLLLVAIILFLLFPVIRSRLNIAMTAILSTLTVILCCKVSMPVAFGIAGVIIFLVLIAPLLFIKWQSYKHTIHGPWDEAIPKI